MALKYFVLTDNYYLKMGIKSFKDRAASFNDAIDVRYLRSYIDDFDNILLPQGDITNLVVVLLLEDVRLMERVIPKLKPRSSKFILLMSSRFFKRKRSDGKINKKLLSVKSGTFHLAKYQGMKYVNSGLTLREKYVLNLISYGFKPKELACLLCVSESTIYRIRDRIFSKLGKVSPLKGMQLCKVFNEFC